MKRKLLFIVVLMALSIGVHAKKYKVAVAMPKAQQTQFERTADWALQTIAAGQAGASDPVELELVWYDEDVMAKKDYQAIANDNEIIAMIGPKTSVHAKVAATAFNAKEKTLLLPVATSTELQRIYSAKPNVFFLSESDMTLSYLMIGGILLHGMKHVSLITSGDVYGQSFSDWFGYTMTELGMQTDMVGIYKTQDELKALIGQWKQIHDGSTEAVKPALFFAPGTEDDGVVLDGMINDAQAEMVYCSDMMMSATLPAKLSHKYKGLAPSLAPGVGFSEAYRERFGSEPVNTEAAVYDALSLVAYAAAVQQQTGKSMNEAMVTAIDGRDACTSSWQDMRDAFAQLHAGKHPDVKGITGALDFDILHHAAPLYSFYSMWHLENGQYSIEQIVSRNRDDADPETLQEWDKLRAQQQQQLNEEQEDFLYPELKDNWAMVIGASDTWDNYRHQADALAIYQMLKRHGYDDDHIVLVLADNIANDPNNIYPGEVYVRPKGTEGAENVYKDVVVDYRLSDVGIGDLRKILLGERSEKYPIVMDCTEHSNIFIYWCGHGNRGKVAWGSNLQLTTETMSGGWKQITDAKKYRKIFAAIDACYSGSIGEAIVGLPGVLYLTAANANEPSKADMLDPDMQIWLSNGFTRAFEQVLWRDPSIKLRDLYQYVARLTTGSHASIYNEAHYGNLFHNSIAEFLPDQVASGIREVQSEGAKNGKWHDLQGRQILQPGKGIYIRDGKKIVIK